MDLSQAEAGFATLQESTPLPVIPISAKEREGLEQLLQHLHRFAKPW
jgi:Fe2+ transport system protein B